MADATSSCPACGARVSTGADRCDLCGTTISSPDASSEEDAHASGESSGEPDTDASESEGRDTDEPKRVFCNQCGFENPTDANYCSRCGTELQDLASPSAAEGARPVAADLPEGSPPSSSADEDAPAQNAEDQAAMGKEIMWMVGLGVFVVLGFFFVTQWSQQYDWGTESSPPEASAAEAGASASATGGNAESASRPSETSLRSLVNELSGSVDGPVADKIDSLRAEEENATGREKRQLQESLVRMYVGAGAPGRAALVQREVADATESVDDRQRAANLLYRWMRQVEQQGDRARVSDVARHVATAYEAVVEERPDDLDARTRMGEAYQLTNNPMKGIQAINAVLEDDSTFVPALFQKGLALLKINRLDESISQFQTVKAYSEAQDPFYKQAERAIEVIREQRTDGSTGGGSPEQ